MFAIVCGLLPPASNFILPGRIFPPLGNETAISQVFVVVFGLAVTYIIFLARSSSVSTIHQRIKLYLLLGIACFCIYLGAHMRFVRNIAVPSTNQTINVSVGYERTKFATETFGPASDWEMLRFRGTDDEEIMKLWTTKSVYIARLVLLGSYLGSLLSLIAFASLGVLLNLRNQVEASL